jgi:hypothetical protein
MHRSQETSKKILVQFSNTQITLWCFTARPYSLPLVLHGNVLIKTSTVQSKWLEFGGTIGYAFCYV